MIIFVGWRTQLLINRSPFGSNDRFVGPDLGDITPENFIQHFGDKTLNTLNSAFEEMGGGMKFTFGIHLIMHSVNGDDV